MATDRFVQELQIWEMLISGGHFEAAAGFIEDIFRRFRALEKNPYEGNEDVAEGLVDTSVAFREIAMQILNDHNGDKLKEWMQHYEQDRSLFKVKCQCHVAEMCKNHTRKMCDEIREEFGFPK